MFKKKLFTVKSLAMLQFVVLILCASYCIGVNAKCSYYQTGGLSFPTGCCTNSTLLEDNSVISSGYYCHFGIFRTYIYYYTYNTANCMGVPLHTFSSPCSSETCSCDMDNSPSQCNINTFSYDSHRNVCFNNNQQFKQQNLTVITSQCINSIKLFEKNGTMYDSQYSTTNCDGNATSVDATCYTLEYHAIDTDTDTDTDSVPFDTTKTSTESNTFLVHEYKGIFTICIIGSISCVACCCFSCMMKKHRKKKKNQIADVHQRNLIENDEELNEEGIDNYHPLEEEEEIDIIPGQNEMIEIDQKVVDQIVSQYIDIDIDDNESDDEDIPAAAYCDEQELEVSISEISELSEGNEGIVEPVEEQHNAENDD